MPRFELLKEFLCSDEMFGPYRLTVINLFLHLLVHWPRRGVEVSAEINAFLAQFDDFVSCLTVFSYALKVSKNKK